MLSQGILKFWNFGNQDFENQQAVKMVLLLWEPLQGWQAHPRMGISGLTSPERAPFPLMWLDFISTGKTEMGSESTAETCKK